MRAGDEKVADDGEDTMGACNRLDEIQLSSDSRIRFVGGEGLSDGALISYD